MNNKENSDGLLLSAKMRKCAEYLASPDFDGNISKLCEEMNIARSTFYRWYDKEDFKRYIDSLINRYTESELVSVWKAVVEAAKGGNLQALKLFFELKNSQSRQKESGGVVFISGEDSIEK